MSEVMTRVITQFERDVIEGLSKEQKTLSSKYFYDTKGDELFQQIMHMEEYYLPEAELEILSQQTENIISDFHHDSFNVIELGAGDGSKTVHFLKNLMALGKDITYYPLDISPNVLAINKALISKALPDLKIELIPGDYFQTLSKIPNDKPMLVLFLGSNLGNFKDEDAVDFITTINSHLLKNDALVLGLDLMKNPKTILAAYNDANGITKEFNLNLLRRINRELGGNFKVNQFDHYPVYNPLTGTCFSFIVSLAEQEVQIGCKSFSFKNGETIHTEVSQKYNFKKIKYLRQSSGFSQLKHLTDSQNLFSINVFS